MNLTCNHEDCGREKNVWLPSDVYFKSEAALHPWCKHCGLVKNVSDDRPHNVGYWINVLSRIASQFSLKQVQKRLIANELCSDECFNDLYGITETAQKEMFIKIVRKYSNIDHSSIYSFDY